MSRTKRLYRVTATYRGRPNFGVTRHYQTRQAAEHRAAVLRDGYDYPGESREDEGRHLDPALSVTITVSDPVTWPTPEAAS